MKRVVMVLILVTNVACNRLESGVILTKTFTPAYTSIVLIPHTTYVGNKRYVTTYTPTPIYHPDLCSVVVSGQYNDKPRQETWSIECGVWRSLKEGDVINPVGEVQKSWEEAK